MPKSVATVFSGGLNRNSPERVDVSESSKQQNLLHIEGNLCSIDGRNLFSQTEIIADTPVKSMYRFYKTGHTVNDTTATTKQGWLLARCGEYVWLGLKQTELVNVCTLNNTSLTLTTTANIKTFPGSGTLLVTPSSGDTTPYQLAYTAKNATTGVLTVGNHPAIPAASTIEIGYFMPILYTVGDTNQAGFASMNGRCYIAANGLYRWDGFYYNVGTVACTGNTTLTGTDTTWTTSVLPGDKVYYGNGATSPHIWYGPYEVSAVGSNTSITLTGNGQSTAGFSPADKADYIIVRMHNAGIQSPTIVPTVTDQASSFLVDTGAHLYKCVVYNTISGKESATAVASASASVTLGQAVFVDMILQSGHTFVTGDRLRVYRTKAGGSTYYHVADQLINPGYKIAGSGLYYSDMTADASLTNALPYGTQDASIYAFVNAPVITIQGSSTALPARTTKYVFTLYNSITNTESNPSLECAAITVAVGHYPIVTMTMTGCDRQADYVNIYRVVDGTDETPYFIATRPWPAAGTSIVYPDSSVSDANLGDAVSYDHDAAPTGVYNLQTFNSTLYAWGDSTYKNRKYKSTINDPEHWPLYEFGYNEPTYTDPTLGGFVDYGDPGTKILSIIPDSGSFSDSGATGSNLLIQSANRAFQWWGKDWTEHRREEAWAGGIASSNCAANCLGTLVWLSRNGPTLKPSGASVPQGCYEKVFPPCRYPFADQVTAGSSTADYFLLCDGVFWRDYYVFTWCQTPSTVPNRMMLLHIPTGTFAEIGTTTYPCEAYCLSVWDGPGDNQELYYGDSKKGFVWRLHAKTGEYTYWTPSTQTGVECFHRTGLIQAPTELERLYYEKHGGRLTLCFDKPSADQSITASVYTNGEETTASDTTTATTVASTVQGGRVYADMGYLTAEGSALMLEWTGLFTRRMVFEGYVYEYTEHGRKV